MLTKGFDLGRPLPLSADERGFGDRAVISSRVIEASIMVVMAAAITVTILSVGNPVALLAEVRSAPQPGADQSMPIIIQTSAVQPLLDPEALSPTDKIAAASQTQRANTESSSSEDLFRQFQAWAAEQDARAKLGRDAQKHRKAARAETQKTQEPRARVRQQNARVQARPVQDTRAQNQAEQDDPVLSFLQSLNPLRAGSPISDAR
jgi:hypothetical protein